MRYINSLKQDYLLTVYRNTDAFLLDFQVAKQLITS